MSQISSDEIVADAIRSDQIVAGAIRSDKLAISHGSGPPITERFMGGLVLGIGIGIIYATLVFFAASGLPSIFH